MACPVFGHPLMTTTMRRDARHGSPLRVPAVILLAEMEDRGGASVDGSWVKGA